MLICNAVCVDRVISSNRCHVVKLPSHKAITLLLILFLFTFYPRSFFLLYSALNGTLSKADVRKIDALDQWCLRRILDIRWYHRVSNWEARRLTEQPPYFDHTEKETHAVWPPDQNGWVSRRQENSGCSSPEWLEKASLTTPLLLDGHSEERPISAQLHLWGCYRNGPG